MGSWGFLIGLSLNLSALLQVELPDLGKLSKFRIWHEKRNPFAGWHLSKVSTWKNDSFLESIV